MSLLRIIDLHKRFGKLHVLKGVNMEVEKGGGKSTLLRCINRLEEPTSGKIIFDGIDITDPKVDINKIRQRI